MVASLVLNRLRQFGQIVATGCQDVVRRHHVWVDSAGSELRKEMCRRLEALASVGTLVEPVPISSIDGISCLDGFVGR